MAFEPAQHLLPVLTAGGGATSRGRNLSAGWGKAGALRIVRSVWRFRGLAAPRILRRRTTRRSPEDPRSHGSQPRRSFSKRILHIAYSSGTAMG